MDPNALPLDSLLHEVQKTRIQREVLEGELASTRVASRKLALSLIFDHRFSLGKVESLTGHMRPTLKSWANVEIARRRANGESSTEIF